MSDGNLSSVSASPTVRPSLVLCVTFSAEVTAFLKRFWPCGPLEASGTHTGLNFHGAADSRSQDSRSHCLEHVRHRRRSTLPSAGFQLAGFGFFLMILWIKPTTLHTTELHIPGPAPPLTMKCQVFRKRHFQKKLFPQEATLRMKTAGESDYRILR